MKTFKQIGYKLIVTLCVVLAICSFFASTPVYAASKVSNEFYYSGTTKGSYTVEKSIVESIVDALEGILDMILGGAAMLFRIVIVGWTALMERLLTWLVEGATGEDVDIEQISTSNITGSDDYITLESIFFNRVPLLNINFFDFNTEVTTDSLGNENEDGSTTTIDDDSLIMILRKAVAGWYYTFRLISIMVMLILLVYIGIKLAIQSSASEKALYKRVLTDWLVGMILVFFIHYLILAIIQFNEILVENIELWSQGTSGLEVYEYGLAERATETVTNTEVEETLYSEVKTRAYDAKMTVGFTGMVMYMVLVYYAWKFTFLYLKRYLTVAVLIMIAPFVAVSYAFNKVKTGKSQIFSTWLKELFFIIILQSIHALVYVIFLQTALAISLDSIASIILVFVLMNFMCKAEGIFRRIFGIQGNLMSGVTEGGIKDLMNSFKTAAAGIGASKVAAKYTKGVASIATKPFRMAGAAGFSGAMKIAANRSNPDKRNDKKLEETKKITLASYANAMRDGSLEEDLSKAGTSVDKIKKTVSRLNDIDNKLKNATGEEKEKLNEERAELLGDEDESVLRDLVEVDANKDKWIGTYDKMTSKRNRALRYGKEKIGEVFNPYNYTTFVPDRDKDGNIIKDKNGKVQGKYHIIKTKRELGNKYLGKKVDSVSMRLAHQLKPENLLGIDAKQKASLKKQTELIKNEVLGFAGIFAGIPLLVAEPAVGATFLYVGATNNAQFYSSKGRKKMKSLKHMRQLPNGKYTVVGFEGTSQETIAEGAQIAAQVEFDKQAQLNGFQRFTHFQARNRYAVRHPIRTMKQAKAGTLKENHPEFYYKLKNTVKDKGKTANALSGVTVGSSATIAAATLTKVGITGAAMTVPVVGAAATTVVLTRVNQNPMALALETQELATKANQKKWENMQKGFNNDMFDEMVLKYFDAEEFKQKSKTERKTTDFAVMYAAITASQKQEVDKMTDDEIQRENGYEEPLETEKAPDGTTKLTGESERNLISNAIVETAQNCGIMDLGEFELTESRMTQIKSSIEKKLKTSGVIENKDKSLDGVIDGLEKKIKEEQAKLAKKGTTPIEEKMTDQAIIAVMKEQGITDPSKVKEADVQAKYTEIYEEKIAGGKTSQSSEDVVNSIKAKSSEGVGQSDGSTAFQEGTSSIVKNTGSSEIHTSDEAGKSVSHCITARQSSLARRRQKTLSKDASKTMRDMLKKKKEFALDSAILTHQQSLDGIKGAGTVGDISANENGGVTSDVTSKLPGFEEFVGTAGIEAATTLANQVSEASPSDTDKVLELLNVQTSLNKAKRELETVPNRTASKREKMSMYIDSLADPRGSLGSRASKTRDGSRRVKGTDSTFEGIDYTQSMDNMLEQIKKRTSKVNY